MSSERVLAVDFGTSCTTAAIRDADGARALEFGYERFLSSVVAVDQAGKLLTGPTAALYAAQSPERVERMPKRSLLLPRVRIAGFSFAGTDLVAELLARVREEAEKALQGKPDRVVLTHPAAWGAAEQALLLKAAEQGGLGRPALLPEPVAAARHYAARGKAPGDRPLVVFDLGAGTFDAAVLRPVRGAYEITHGGDAHLGGEDLTEALESLVRDLAVARDPLAWADGVGGDGTQAGQAAAALRANLEQAKRALSDELMVPIYVPGYADPFEVTRPAYEAAIEDLLQRAVAELLATLRRAGLPPGEAEHVLLAGGASRTPRVSDLLAEKLGRVPLAAPDPKTVTALGALEDGQPGWGAAGPGGGGGRGGAGGDTGTDDADLDMSVVYERNLFDEL
jgi:molecular chaperone DnaK